MLKQYNSSSYKVKALLETSQNPADRTEQIQQTLQ